MYKLLFFAGLAFILSGIVARSIGWQTPHYLSLIFIGAAFKTHYLFLSIRSGKLRITPPLFVLLAGISLVLISLLLKHVFALVVIAKTVLFIGITLKIVALILFGLRSRR